MRKKREKGNKDKEKIKKPVSRCNSLRVLQVAAQGPDPKEMEEKVDKMAETLESLQTRFARLFATSDATHSKLKHRVNRLERKLAPPPTTPGHAHS